MARSRRAASAEVNGMKPELGNLQAIVLARRMLMGTSQGARSTMPELSVVMIAQDSEQRAVLQVLVDGTSVARVVHTCASLSGGGHGPGIAPGPERESPGRAGRRARGQSTRWPCARLN